METILEKVTLALQYSKIDENNKTVYPSEFIESFFSEDPELETIREKTKKVIDLYNDAVENQDTDFLNRDFETDIWVNL